MAAPPDHRRSAPLLSLTLLLITLHAAFLRGGMATSAPGGTSMYRHHIDAIYNFGDSISDTGNRLRELGGASVSGSLPYGETLGEPTGRSSDGLLMIDYLAEFLNLPYLPPYLDKSANFDHGANFAVSGATALNHSFLLERGIRWAFTNSSLSVQLQWFKTHLSSMCTSNEDCKERLEKALFLVGEVGGNDYNYGFWVNKTIEELKTYVPQVVGCIVNATKELINLGAINLIVPGNFPVGCFPCYLTLEGQTSDVEQKNVNCINHFNEFAKFHNDQLKLALNHLRMDYPHATIKYADYYNTFLALLNAADSYGFDKNSLFKACCGIGGAFNYAPSCKCGAQGVSLCPNPSKFISWDGVHLTQEAYRNMAVLIFGGMFSDLPMAKILLDTSIL